MSIEAKISKNTHINTAGHINPYRLIEFPMVFKLKD